jgi:hypothetical protein
VDPALCHVVDHAPADALQLHVERHGGELVRLVPVARPPRPGRAAPTQTDPETERWLLYSRSSACWPSSAPRPRSSCSSTTCSGPTGRR